MQNPTEMTGVDEVALSLLDELGCDFSCDCCCFLAPSKYTVAENKRLKELAKRLYDLLATQALEPEGQPASASSTHEQTE